MTNSVILLVEDNPDDMELTLFSLKAGGFNQKVVTARDGSEALEYMFATGPHEGRDVHDTPGLILLDLKMPKLNGLDVLKALRADERTKRVPVVLLTTSDEDMDRITGYNLGVNSYICKPVDYDEFVSTVKQLGLYWLVKNIPSPR